MPVGQQTDEELVEQGVLAHNHAVQFLQQAVERLRRGLHLLTDVAYIHFRH
jgi:hypothetical protein